MSASASGARARERRRNWRRLRANTPSLPVIHFLLSAMASVHQPDSDRSTSATPSRSTTRLRTAVADQPEASSATHRSSKRRKEGSVSAPGSLAACPATPIALSSALPPDAAWTEGEVAALLAAVAASRTVDPDSIPPWNHISAGFQGRRSVMACAVKHAMVMAQREHKGPCTPG